MKKQFLFLMMAIFIGLWSCKKDEDDNTVKDLKVNFTVGEKNLVSFTASATNANTYSWDFADGNTGSGAAVEHKFKMAGTYKVKCTATGQTNSISKTVDVKVTYEDPSVYNTVSKLLVGFTVDNPEGTAVWRWAADTCMFSCGPKTHVYTAGGDTADYDIFDVYDDSWWHNNANEPINDEALDDEYSFRLNQNFEYVNSYKETGFMWNWAWAKYTLNQTVEEWGDVALLQPSDTVTSWELEIKDIPADSTFRTIVNGQPETNAYIIHIKGGQYLGIASAASRSNDAHWYQIIRIDSDTLKIRYDNTYPQDLTPDPNWKDSHPLGEGEWGYITFVKSN